MAHSASARKRIRQNEKNRMLNRRRKGVIKDQVKAFTDTLATGDKEKSAETFKATARLLDKIAASKTIHKKTAARRKSRLAKRLNALAVAKA
jgi:small subunit ribosomal protein S20